VTIRISIATTDDLPQIVASVDALSATDAGAHNAAATNLRWASENGIAYYTSLLADGNNLVLLARDDNEVAGHLVGRISGPGSVHPIRVADLESVHVYPAHRDRGVGERLATAFLAALLILLTAVDEGLGAVYFGIVDHETRALRTEFGIPDDHQPIGAIAIGHDGETERANLASRRRPLAEMIHYGQW
jgi:GNAT superfamily N-acetyltransferase